MNATATRLEGPVLEAIHGRRAVRAYQPTPLDEATVKTLLDAAVQAPTAMHQEPWVFVVIQDRKMLKRFSEAAKALLADEAIRHRQLLRAPGLSPSEEHLARLLSDPAFNIFYDAGTLIVICARPKGAFVTADCWLAAENLMLAAHALELGSCCIGFAVPLLNSPEVKRELQIPMDVVAVAPIIVGTPAGVTPAVPRKPPEILSWAR
ncbi:MAG TPA: nitroreductase family protein [Gemmatimonadales bacterium]|nr:nitroreductase family protein [Gemmatimonadales bacterium]